MKILHLLSSPWFTGPAETMLLLATAQRALGHDVEVAIDRRRTDATSEELAAPHLERLHLGCSLPLALSTKSGPWAIGRDLTLLRGVQAEVVHSHFSHDHWLARWALPPTCTLVRSIHKPTALTWSTPRADAWTITDESLSRRLLGQRVAVLPALVDDRFSPSHDRQALRRQLDLPAGRLVGMVSTFQPSRRHDVGLQAFAQLARLQGDVHLVLLGDGVLGPALQAQARALGVEGRVLFRGYRAGDDFAHHVQALDEVWILGLGNDFAARAAAQARACGCRVVAVDEGALSRYADATVEATPDAVVAAALGARAPLSSRETNEAIARRLCHLYEQARR